MLRLVIVLMGAMILGGAGAVFVWSTLNAVSTGDAGWPRVVLVILVALAIIGMLAWVVRFVRDFEGPEQ